jgi:hypothetical protein
MTLPVVTTISGRFDRRSANLVVASAFKPMSNTDRFSNNCINAVANQQVGSLREEPAVSLELPILAPIPGLGNVA